jgi:DNA-binding IclR family transcriptional regulator
MDRLSKALDRREVLVTVAAGDEIVTIARAGRRHARSLEIGQRVPLVAPIGASFVAWAADEEVEKWRGSEVASDGVRSFYDQILQTTKLQGYSVITETKPNVQIVTDAVAWAEAHPEPTTRQELRRALSTLVPAGPDDLARSREGIYAVRSIGAPVFDAEGRASMAISISDLPDLLSASELSELSTRFREAAATVTRQTRGVLPEEWPAVTA